MSELVLTLIQSSYICFVMSMSVIHVCDDGLLNFCIMVKNEDSFISTLWKYNLIDAYILLESEKKNRIFSSLCLNS